MADDNALPVPQPLATAPAQSTQSASALPPPTPVATSSELPAPTPVAISNEPLPAPTDLSTQPISDKTHGILSNLKEKLIDPLAKMVTGPGTMLGTETAGPSWSDLVHESPAETWRKFKLAGHDTLDASLIIPSNAFTPEERAAHPHLAAASQGISDVVKGLTTPGNLALMLGTSGLGTMPAALEKTLGGFEATAPYAAKAAKAAKVALQGMGVYFTASQIKQVMSEVPEVAQAVFTGQTDKAIQLATSAFVNGVVAHSAYKETVNSLRGSVDAAAENSAMKHKDYADVVRERQKTLQLAGGQKEQIADLGRTAAPNIKDREWATEYVEANKDRGLMRKRQAETLAGPQPSQAIIDIQGGEVPLEPVKPTLTYRTDDNGTQWAKSSDFPTEVSIPKDVEGEAADKYAQEKIDLQKQFAASRTHAEPTETKPIPEDDLSSPASQHALALKAAIEDAREAAKSHVITPEERATMAEQQDPDRALSPKQRSAIDSVIGWMDRIKKEAQKRDLLPQGHVRSNFVPHEYDFDDSSDPTKARLYDTYHDAQQAGLVGKNKDYFALASDYVPKMARKIADADTIKGLKTGRTIDGAPLAVPGGFVEGQKVSTEGPKSHVMDETEVKRQMKNGQLPGLIKSGRVTVDPTGKIFTMNTADFVPAKNLYENVPIGPTPIPPNTLAAMRENGTLDALLKSGHVFEGTGKDGKPAVFNKEHLYARVPVYLHPDIANHFNDVVKPETATPTTWFGRAGKMYDDATGNMKSLLLSWSPFHRVTESMRMMESLGIVPGGKLAVQTNLGMAPKIDYFNLQPWQEAAIRDGIVTADPRGRSNSNVEEGLSGGEGNSWGARTYRMFDKGLEKIGVPPEIRNKVNLQHILTDDVFGPQGMITNAKFELYKNRKPEIASQISKDHPDWSPQDVDRKAGEIAARFANDKFGGLNHILIGRTLNDQKILRRVLLAPDFLESTGRSVLDLADKYGSGMAANFIRFNIAHLLTAAGINYALHHNDEDQTIKGGVDASHILDHPYDVVGPDGKTVYGLRTTATDFLHMVNRPREFTFNRINPAIRAADEVVTQRNEYGRKESLGEALKAIPKAALPIQIQNAVGLGPNTTTEPTAGDQFMKSIGIQARPNRSPAEQLAIDKVNAHLQGQEARTGQALVRQQLKFNAEDKLRSAYTMLDPERKKAAIEDAKHDIANLASRKIIDPEEVKKINTDARGSRLKSIFNSLEPSDALEVWDKATDQEKKELDVAMNAKYLRWRENLAKHGQNVNSLNVDDQEILNKFRKASSEAAEIKSRPEPPPKPVKKTVTEERKSAPARGGEELPPPTDVPAELPPPIPLATTGDYTPLVAEAAKKYGVDATLISAMIHQESLENPNAVSKKGARGLLQLEPITARQYGVTDVKDPRQNINAGVHYMADLLKEYHGDEAKALAAYNAGPTAVHKYGGVPPYKETQDYVSKIQGRNSQ